MSQRASPQRQPTWKWRLSRVGPLLLYRFGLGPVIGRTVLLLTTTGRKSGLPRTVPLQYEEINGDIYVASARGQQADWFRNIAANPEVSVRVGGRHFRGKATPVVDPIRIADFLEIRLQRHPRMVGAIMSSAGLPRNPTRAQLEAYASNRALVVIHPSAEDLS